MPFTVQPVMAFRGKKLCSHDRSTGIEHASHQDLTTNVAACHCYQEISEAAGKYASRILTSQQCISIFRVVCVSERSYGNTCVEK